MNECNIVNDLMPLYADELASPDSIEYIHRHIAWCPECGEIWKRLSAHIPEVNPREEANNYRKAIRRGKRKIFLKSFFLCLIIAAIAAIIIEYQLYTFEVSPVSQSYPSPDGKITIEVVEKEDARLFYRGEGIMVRFKLENQDGVFAGLNSHPTQWDTLSVHWSPDSQHVVLDVVTIDGSHALFLTDATLEYHNGGHVEIPGITENLTLLFEEALQAEVTFDSIDFSFETWQEDCQTALFRYETDSGSTGTIDYHYPTESITDIR